MINAYYINKPTPITWEYIAGFFDGEGCIYNNERTYGKQHYVTVKISQGIVNSSCGVMDDILLFLVEKGIKARIYRDNKPPTAKLEVITSSASSCRDWLQGMLPYLRVKRGKAVATISYIENNWKFMWASPLQIQQILELRRQKLGIRRIGTALNMDRGSIKKILIRHNAYTERFKPGKSNPS